VTDKPVIESAESRINPSGGFDVVEESLKKHSIRPTGRSPKKAGHRCKLTPKIAGLIERIAREKSSIEKGIEELKGRGIVENLGIAQSVVASSQIEGENMTGKELESFLHAITQPENNVETSDLSQRRKAYASIYEAYLWALNLDKKNYVDYALVMELHRRMFATTIPEFAGKLKKKSVDIKGAGYQVTTLAPNRTKAYLDALCKNTNRRLRDVEFAAEEAFLLVIAEFILDFLAIHPFQDGNGRTARLLSTYLLKRCGYHFAPLYSLDRIILETREDYYHDLFHSQLNWWNEQEDITPWIEYYITAVNMQCERAQQYIALQKRGGPRARPGKAPDR